MRVTANTFPDSLVEQLRHLSVRQYRLQNQAATGQRVVNPGDDPAAFTRTMGLQAEARQTAQYGDNIDRLLESGTATYEVMRGLKRVGDRASELALLADDTKSPDELNIYAIELNSLIEQAAEAANTQFRDRYLLGGTATDQPPFEVVKDANGQVTAVNFVGNSNTAEAEIAEGVTVTTQSVGANTTGSGLRGLVEDSRFGADLFGHLISLRDNLQAGDTAAIRTTDLPALLADEDNILIHFGINGATAARLEAAKSSGERRNEATEILISQEVDADVAETIVRLNQTQFAYEAALQSGGRLLNTSLLDYIR